MNLRISHCFLPVDDHDKAIGFYRDAIGLEVHADVGSENMRWVTVGTPLQPDLELVLEPPIADPNATAAERQAVADLMAKGMFGRVVFSTEDCDTTFARVRAAGAEVVQEPKDQPHGVRDCAFRDPAGNLVRFSQPSTR